MGGDQRVSCAGFSDPWAPAPVPSRRRRAWPVRPFLAWALSLGTLPGAWRLGLQRWSFVAVAAVAALGMELILRRRDPSAGRARVVWVVALVALATALSLVIGETSSGFLLAVAFTAHAALVAWRPWRSLKQRRTATTKLAVGVLLAADVAWFRTGSRSLMAVMVITAMLLVDASARWPEPFEAAEDGVLRACRGLGAFLARAVLFPLAVVFLYVPGAVARLLRVPGRRRGWRQGPSNWNAVTTSLFETRRNALRPFGGTPPAVRGRRLRLGIGLVAALVAAPLAWSDRFVDTVADVPLPAATRSSTTIAATAPSGRVFAVGIAAKYSDLPAYAGSKWADKLQEAQGQLDRDGELSGKYRNVHHGDRVTRRPPECDCPRVTMWISGGSAVFGEGQRDDHTIASELVGLAAADGIALDLRNVSRDGYTFQMETEWQLLPLLRIEDPPAVLVVYGGFNDVMAELAAEFLHGGDSQLPVAAFLPSDIDAINDRTDEFLASDIGTHAGIVAASRYRRLQESLDAAALANGVQVDYFFQADALSSADQLAPYEAINGIDTSEMMASPIAEALSSMAHELSPKVVDLRKALWGKSESYFLGLVHHNERGARIVAKDIYRHIRDQIHAAAD